MAKKSNKRATKVAEAVYMGDEPVWDSLAELTDTEIQTKMLKAFAWYNWRYDPAERPKLILRYVEAVGKKGGLAKKISRAVKATDGWKISPTVCYLARMLTIGTPLPEKDWAYFNDQLAQIVANAPKKVHTVAVDAPVVSVQQRMLEKISDQICELELFVDHVFDNPKAADFNMYEWLGKNNIKGKSAKIIGQNFVALRDELKSVVVGHDPQLTESYKIYSKMHLRAMLKLVHAICNDCETWASNSNKGRKPHKKNIVSKMADKVQILARDDTFKIVSVDPTSVVGASQAWVFNVKSRMLAVYISADEHGLTLSRSSIRNFNTTTSTSKKLRKPDMILSRVRDGGKIALRKMLTNIKATEKNVSGRLNNKMIIVRVIK